MYTYVYMFDITPQGLVGFTRGNSTFAGSDRAGRIRVYYRACCNCLQLSASVPAFCEWAPDGPLPTFGRRAGATCRRASWLLQDRNNHDNHNHNHNNNNNDNDNDNNNNNDDSNDNHNHNHNTINNDNNENDTQFNIDIISIILVILLILYSPGSWLLQESLSIWGG